MSKTTAHFNLEKIWLDVRPTFNFEDVAASFDTMLVEKTPHSINRVLRHFKLRKHHIYLEARQALRDLCLMDLKKMHLGSCVVYFLPHKNQTRFGVYGPLTKEEKEVPVIKEDKRNAKNWCCAILATAVVASYFAFQMSVCEELKKYF